MNKKLAILLRDFDYELRGKNLWTVKVAWVPACYVFTCRDIYDAAERLIPIIADSDYHRRLAAITG